MIGSPTVRERYHRGIAGKGKAAALKLDGRRVRF
jgi:hypothetical protein